MANDTVKSGLSIVYIEGSKVIISTYITFVSLKVGFVLANIAEPDETRISLAVSGPKRVKYNP